jgi:hypothetical protein
VTPYQEFERNFGGKTVLAGLPFEAKKAKVSIYFIRWDFNEGFWFHVANKEYLPLDGVQIRYRPFERQMPVDIQRLSSALETVLRSLDLFLRCFKKSYRCSKLKKASSQLSRRQSQIMARMNVISTNSQYGVRNLVGI